MWLWMGCRWSASCLLLLAAEKEAPLGLGFNTCLVLRIAQLVPFSCSCSWSVPSKPVLGVCTSSSVGLKTLGTPRRDIGLPLGTPQLGQGKETPPPESQIQALGLGLSIYNNL